MKPKNFPARKLERKLRAQGKPLLDGNNNPVPAWLEARGIRTKKDRSDQIGYRPGTF